MDPLTDAQAAEARRLVDAAYRDDTPTPSIGSAEPVTQPGRPPMSQRATDASVVMLAGGTSTLLAGGGIALGLHALADVDPLALALVGGAATGVLLAVARLVRATGQAAGQAAPVTKNYNAPITVNQEINTTMTTTKGLYARTNNGENR